MSKLQASRYELKYLISESKAKRILNEIQTRLQPDDHTLDSKGYHIRSLYMDSRNLHCYKQTSDGVKNRFKLRIRFYDDDPTSPVFLEVKRRVTNVVQKKRAGVFREAGQKIASGSAPHPEMLINNNAQQRDALNAFCRLRDQLGAVGHIYVDYFRQAFECGTHNHYRVTFDRDVLGSKFKPGSKLEIPPRRMMSKINGVVLELKFVERPAPWMLQLANQYGLSAISVPKYVECVDVLRPVTGGTGAFA